MPIYEYECKICKRKVEVKESINEPKEIIKCPKCGILVRSNFEKLISKSTFQIKFKPFH